MFQRKGYEMDKQSVLRLAKNIAENGGVPPSNDVRNIAALLVELAASGERVEESAPAAPTFPKLITIHLHSSKESNYDIADEIGLSKEATNLFAYALYEVALGVEVSENGETKIVSVDGKGLAC